MGDAVIDHVKGNGIRIRSGSDKRLLNAGIIDIQGADRGHRQHKGGCIRRNVLLYHGFRILISQERVEGAAEFIRRAECTDPDETEKQVLFHKGRICEILDQDEETAETYYVKALDGHWDVGLVACADRLARLKALRGERAEAIALWEKARALAPDNVSVLWNLTIAYRDSGQPEKSAEMLERVRVLTGNPDLGKE